MKQRAEHLVKRVMELEEQLRIMAIQRKKAEKAAAEVLAILEDQGIGDFTEVIDSSSDQDDANHSLEGNGGTLKEDEASTTSIMGKSEAEDGLSGSEREDSPVQGRSLSWKGSNTSPNSHEKLKMQRRRSGFMPTVDYSVKHHLGKSCRKIKQSEMRLAVESVSDNTIVDVHEKRGNIQSDHYDEQLDVSREVSRNEMDKVLPHTSVSSSLVDKVKETDGGLYVKRGDGDEEMERVLEQQAQLIGQYQAEENAQKEWEEKYNENKNSTLHLNESRKQPDPDETSSGSKEESTELSGKSPYYVEEANPRGENISITEGPSVQNLSNASMLTVGVFHDIDPEKTGRSEEVAAIGLPNGFGHNDLTTNGGISYQPLSDSDSGQLFRVKVVQDTDTSLHEFAFPSQGHSNMNTNSMQIQGVYGNSKSYSNTSSHPHGNGFAESPSSRSPSSVNSGGKFSKWQHSEMQNQLSLLPQSSSSRVEGVLQGLQHAKTSLGQISGIALSSRGSTLATIAPAYCRDRTVEFGGALEVPFGPSGLFKLPTDPLPPNNIFIPNVYGSGLGSSRPDVGYARADNGYRYPTTTYVETGSRAVVGGRYFDPYVTSGTRMPASVGRQYFDPYNAYMHLTTEIAPLRDGYSRPGTDVRNQTPAGDRYSYAGDGALSDLRRL